MRFQRGLTRSIAVLTSISLLLPAAVFAFVGAVPAASLAPASAAAAQVPSGVEAPAAFSVVTLHAQDVFGLLNGEIGGIPQFGLTADMGLNAWSPAPQNLASHIGAMRAAQADAYLAKPLPSPEALPGAVLVGAGSEVLRKADAQASEALKLASPGSMPRLLELPTQASARAMTIKDLLDRTLASAPAAPAVPKAVEGSHRFGTVMTGARPTVDTAPLGRAWAAAVFGSFTAELVLRLGTVPEGTLTSALPAWMAIWLELLIGLAGCAALSRAQRGHSARQALLVILKREQRE
jgi:hypothetical protein